MLNQWLLSLFNVERFEELAEHLRDEALEGLDENNIHRFHHTLAAHFPDLPQLPSELLLEYDQNIVKHTQRLNERRITRGEEPTVWKYFQYLALLFSEIYLDRYFRDPKALLKELNIQVAACNTEQGRRLIGSLAFDEAAEAWPQLNKLAFWMATGSGKTLLMHANILQYQHGLDPARAAARVEPDPPAYAQRRALPAAPARVRGGGHRRQTVQQGRPRAVQRAGG